MPEVSGAAVRKTASGPGIEIVPALVVPPPAAGEVTVQVRFAGICGTDLHIDDWYPAYHFMRPHLPVTLGHEFSGVVHACSDAASQPAVGQRVVVRPSTTCGTCAACRAATPDQCIDRKGIGITRDGAFAPFINVPARNCIALPSGLRDDVAALAEPFSIAWRAVDQAAGIGRPLHGRRVLVLGPGIIGQAIAILARRAGAHVAVIGKDDAVRCGALRRLGFDDVEDIADPAGELRAEAWAPFDIAFEATGVPESIQSALPRLRQGGVLVATGIHPRPLALDVTGLVRREITLRGSFRAPEAVWDDVLELLLALQGQVAQLITHRMTLAAAQQGFDLARRKLAGKVLLTPIGELAA